MALYLVFSLVHMILRLPTLSCRQTGRQAFLWAMEDSNLPPSD